MPRFETAPHQFFIISKIMENINYDTPKVCTVHNKIESIKNKNFVTFIFLPSGFTQNLHGEGLVFRGT